VVYAEFEHVEVEQTVTVPLLLGLAWIAFLARYGVQFLPSRRPTSTLPGLPPLPSRSMLAQRSAAFAGRPAPVSRRTVAARRRLRVLIALLVVTALNVLVWALTASPVFLLLSGLSALALLGFCNLLVRRRKALQQAHIDRLWAQGRYDEVGQARVMSLEEARRRAEQIAAPVYVAAPRQHRVG
jgi:hypothetical protein